jgi:hypothetical protein
MSRGPGKVERAIAAALDAEPDNAFTVEDLCDRVYLGVNRIEKKHRVAILRAAANLMKRRDTLDRMQSDGLGGASVYYNLDNVMSYAMARLKSDFLNNYRSNDPRVHPSNIETEADLRAKLAKGGDDYEHVKRGGAWWTFTQEHIAELEAKRSGDKKRLAKVRKAIKAAH